MDWIRRIFEAAPELALFIALALGHALGRLKLRGFSLGGVAGSLIVALAIGEIVRVTLPDALKAVCFALFIYAVGFKSGPEFFGSLTRSSLKLVFSSTVQCVVALLTVIALSRFLGLGKGYSAGMGSGALTQTAMLGTAGDALARMNLSPDKVGELGSQMAVGFAITYVFGTIGVIVFLRNFAPRLLRVDARKAARELEAELSQGGPVTRPGYISPFVPVVARAFQVQENRAAGLTVAALTTRLERASVERVLRGTVSIEPTPDTQLQRGDIVGVAGLLESVMAAGELIGPEIESQEALTFPVATAAVVVANRNVVGKSLAQIRDSIGVQNLQGVYLMAFKRQSLSLPILAGSEVRRGDILEFAGRPGALQSVAAQLGRAESPGGKSDLAFHALAIVLGILLGLITVSLGGIPLTLGMGGGVLVAGLCFGWWHTRFPARGGLPGPAQWILAELGLSAFAALVGLSAGPMAVAALRQEGLTLLLAGMIVTLLPLIAALYFGRFILKLNPVVLLGALCGGQTVAAALNAVNEETDSTTPVLGFTVTYAISNVLLAVWGPVIVALT